MMAIASRFLLMDRDQRGGHPGRDEHLRVADLHRLRTQRRRRVRRLGVPVPPQKHLGDPGLRQRGRIVPADLARAANDVVGHLEKRPGTEIEERPQAEASKKNTVCITPRRSARSRPARTVSSATVGPSFAHSTSARTSSARALSCELPLDSATSSASEVIEPVPVARERPRRPR